MTGWRQIDVPGLILLKSPMLKGYQKRAPGGHLTVFVGREPDGFHLSISHRTNDQKPGRYPTWDEIRDARYEFCPDELTMAMILPPKGEYVNAHETTFHLWEIDGDEDEVGTDG